MFESIGVILGNIDPKALAVLATSAPVITILTQFLKQRKVSKRIPAWALPAVPMLLGAVASMVSNAFNITVDLSPVAGALVGGSMASAVFGIAKGAGVAKGSGHGT